MPIESDPRSTWNPAEVRRVAHRVADLLADYLERLPDKPVFSPVPIDEAARFAAEPPPVEGTHPDAILDEFARSIAPYPFGNGHPRFWGWINSPPAVMGIFADMLAAGMNPSVAGGNHAAVHLERQVTRWFAELLGLPATTMGLLVSGGSMANLTALAAARHAKAGFDVRTRGLQSGDQRLVVYMSEEGHACVRKSCELLGIGTDSLRTIPVNGRFQMRTDVLVDTIERDIQDGFRPIAVAASAGTVNTGAIDDLESIAKICRARDVWFHVDGAYGAAAALSSRCRSSLAGLDEADSVALDPHKWLYVPVETGLVLVRDGSILRSAFSHVPSYLRTDGDPRGVGGLPWLSEYGFQQTRSFRALKLWMALKYYGTAGYGRAIDHDLDVAGYLADSVRRDSRLELMAPPSLSIVCFRARPANVTGEEELNELNRRVLERLQMSGRAFVSSTVLKGRFVLRAAIVNPLSAQRDIDVLLDAVTAFAGEIADRLPVA